MRSRLFAERFLVAVTGPPLPAPDHYDEQRGYSVDPAGRPFIEGGRGLDTVTLTEAGGEPNDDDRDRLAVITKTKASGEPVDRPVEATAGLGTVTQTFTDGEGADDDRDRRVSAPDGAAYTDTRAPDERPDAWSWGYTDTKAMGERPDSEPSFSLATITKVDGERND